MSNQNKISTTTLGESTQVPAKLSLAGKDYAGELYLSPEQGVEFRFFVHGIAFDLLAMMQQAGRSMIPVLHGITSEGKYTIGNCMFQNITTNSSGITEGTIVGDWILMGEHITNLNSNSFHAVEIVLEGLASWLSNPKSFEFLSHNSDQNIGPQCSASVTATTYGFFDFSLTEGRMRCHSNNVILANGSNCHIHLDSRHSIVLNSPSPRGISSLLEHASSLRQIASLLYGDLLPLKKIDFISRTADSATRRHSFYLRVNGQSHTPQPSPFLKYDSVKHIFPDLLAKYIAYRDSFFIQAELLHANELMPGQPTDFQLLGLCSALESHHRNFFGGTYLSNSDYEKTKDAMLAAIPSGLPSAYKQSLKSMITYSNEPSLRSRLRSIISLLGDSITSALFENSKEFVHNIVQTRNALTHRLPESDEAILKDERLVWSCEQLKWLLRAIMLYDLGIPVSMIASRVKLAPEIAIAKEAGAGRAPS